MRLTAATLFLVFLTGCGWDLCGRLAVNDELRSACGPSYQYRDEDIQAVLWECEHQRLSGMTKERELQQMLRLCDYNLYRYTCVRCSLAVVDQIYGL